MDLHESVDGVLNVCSALMLVEGRSRESRQCAPNLFRLILCSWDLTVFIVLTQLIPHADVLFLNRHYAQAQSPAYASAPRAFLLALTRLAPPHALLVAYWGAEGAAALSVPTREYFQSSGWTGPPTPPAATSSSSSILPSYNVTPSTARHCHHHLHHHPWNGIEEAQGVRSESRSRAAGHDSSNGRSVFSAMQMWQCPANPGSPRPPARRETPSCTQTTQQT